MNSRQEERGVEGLLEKYLNPHQRHYHHFFNQNFDTEEAFIARCLSQLQSSEQELDVERKQRLVEICEKFAPFRLLITVEMSKFPEMMIEVEDQLLQVREELSQVSEEESLALILEETKLLAFRKQLIEAIKIYFQYQKENPHSEPKPLLNHFIEEMQAEVSDVNQLPNEFREVPENHDKADPVDDNFLLHYVYEYGNEEDRGFLLSNGYSQPSYFYDFVKTAYQGLGNIVDAIGGLPKELSDQFTLWQMRKNFNRQKYEQAKQRIIGRLANCATKEERLEILKELEEDEFDLDKKEAEGKEKEGQEKKKEKGSKKGKEKDDEVINFSDFHKKLSQEAQINSSKNLWVFHPENLEIIESLGKALDEPYSYFYSEKEKEIFRIALNTQQRIRATHQTQEGDLRKLMDAGLIKNNRNIRLSLAMDLTRKEDEEKIYKESEQPEEREKEEKRQKIFEKLKERHKGDEDKLEEINARQRQWEKIMSLAMLPSRALYEMTQDLDRLEEYSVLLKLELKLDKNPEEYQNIARYRKSLKALIEQRRQQIIDTMLAKLALLSKDQLYPKENQNEDEKNNGDLVLATIESLTTKFRFSEDYDQYLQTLRKQIPPQTITAQEIREFNAFITSFGTEEQKTARLHLYYGEAQTQNGSEKELHDKSKDKNEKEKEHLVYVPTRVHKHLDHRILSATPTAGSIWFTSLPDDESETPKLPENNQNQPSEEANPPTLKQATDINPTMFQSGNHSLIMVGTDERVNLFPAAPAKVDEAIPTQTDNVEKLNELMKMSLQLMDTEGTEERVCIPFTELTPKHVDPKNEQEVKEFYDSVNLDESWVTGITSSGVEKYIDEKAKTFFASQTNQSNFVEAAREDFRSDEEIDATCETAYKHAAKLAYTLRANTSFPNSISNANFKLIAETLTEQFYQLGNKADKKFEQHVLDQTLEVMVKMLCHSTFLRKEMEKAGLKEERIQYAIDLFKKNACEYFQKDENHSPKHLKANFAKAEMDMRIQLRLDSIKMELQEAGLEEERINYGTGLFRKKACEYFQKDEKHSPAKLKANITEAEMDMRIQLRLDSIKTKMKKDKFSQDEIKFHKLRFRKKAKKYFEVSQNDSSENLKANIAEAEIDILINIHEKSIDEKHRKAFKIAVKKEIKANGDWPNDQNLWMEIINKEKLRNRLISFLENQRDCIAESRCWWIYSKRTTNDKIKGINKKLGKIKNFNKGYEQLCGYVEGLADKKQHKNLHAKRRWGSSLFFWTESTITEEMREFNKVNLPKR